MQPPPPPDRAAFEARPPPLPARGFAIGVAVAGVAAVVISGYVRPSLEAPFTIGEGVVPTIAGLLALAAIAGLAGGWLSWRWLTRGLPVSWPRTLSVVVSTTLLSLLIACFVAGLLAGGAVLVNGLITGKDEAIVAAIGIFVGAFYVAPLFVVWLFGPTFGGLVLVWTLAWRYRVNRRVG